MDYTSSSDYPSSTDQMSSSNTWSTPAPLPTYGGDGMNSGSDSMGYGGNSMSYGGNSMSYGGNNNKYGGDNSYGGGNPSGDGNNSYGGDNNTSSYLPQYGNPSSVYQPYPSPTYGSGSNSWGSGGNPYDDCVQQCQAKYPSSMSPPQDSPSQTSKTHVVYVAPTQGVLRYVPFAVNASVGDTVKFIWGANNHTVTKGSELTPCNATSDSPFASGLQLKDFTFEQVVNDTNPVFFYCAVPGHCTKGMFGIINPPNALGSPSSVGSMMQSMAAANPNIAKMHTYTDNATMNSTGAYEWGTSFDMSSIPQWAQASFVENVLYTRLFLAANPDAFQNGSIDASLGGNPPVVPQDITQVALNNSPDYGYGSNPVSSSVMTSTSTVAPSPTSSSSNASGDLSGNGATSAARSGVTVVLAVFAAGLFLL
jgi:plastocyanin